MSIETLTNDDSQHPASEPPRLVAVVDIGATSIRMAIAEIVGDQFAHTLESLTQAVSLGNDSFAKGKISRDTMEDCVHVLKIYRTKLNEYGINSDRQIRVVATSAVREAANQLAFQDRVYIATGFEIEPFDEAELHRATLLGVQPILDHLQCPSVMTIAYEIGGGSTELLALQNNDVFFSKTYRLGALRLQRSIDGLLAGNAEHSEIMESQITKVVNQIKQSLPDEPERMLVAMGGDIRLVANHFHCLEKDEVVGRLPVKKLRAFTNSVLQTSTNQIVRDYHLSLPVAELLGPALLSHCMLAEGLNAENLLVANTNLRDGLIQEMAMGRVWSDTIEDQIIRSAIGLGRKCQFDENHALHVAETAKKIFSQLEPWHGVETRYASILYLAALLHEIGLFIGSRGYHKHSMYLIRNSDFFGIGSRDLELVALVARYHRRAAPQPEHEGYSTLNRRDRVIVAKLASILRIAVCLDANRNQRISDFSCEVNQKRLTIRVRNVTDLSLERIELRQSGNLFRDTFGNSVQLTIHRDS